MLSQIKLWYSESFRLILFAIYKTKSWTLFFNFKNCKICRKKQQKHFHIWGCLMFSFLYTLNNVSIWIVLSANGFKICRNYDLRSVFAAKKRTFLLVEVAIKLFSPLLLISPCIGDWIAEFWVSCNCCLLKRNSKDQYLEPLFLLLWNQHYYIFS